MPFPRLQVGHKTGVLHPTCDLQFLHWNPTHLFCRTYYGAELLGEGQSLARSNVVVNSSFGGQQRQSAKAVDGGSQRRQLTEAFFDGEQRSRQQQHRRLTEAVNGGSQRGQSLTRSNVAVNSSIVGLLRQSREAVDRGNFWQRATL